MKSLPFRLSLLLLIIPWSFPLLNAAEPPAEIPFNLYGGFAIVVRGAIGSQENLNFLVDTGAVPSVVHQRLARKLNLSGPREDISVVTQSRSVERVALPQVRLGLVDLPSVSAVVLDLAPIEKRLGLRLDAIVGLDVLGGQDFTIDYRLRQILIGAATTSGEAIPFELGMEADAPYVVVRMEMDSQFVRLLLDTGADSITLFASRVQGRTLALQKPGSRKDVSAGGEYAVESVQLSDVRLGEMKRGKRQATMVETAASALRDFDGMLGPTSLGITRLAFDFRNKILYLQIDR
ncbi:MAG TPA: pepsin/retropepsin-like aspartic protease family protein [Candidatus Acidoferrum sp.]|nr:pepsin/retropepsin-like aspartic protease family protein [Candidatus Acidoferrum sp.]